MRNYDTYLRGMSKSNKEKLFFVNKINWRKIHRIIDFGCGKGDLLKYCAKSPNCRFVKDFIGIDKDPVMRDIAKENLPYAHFSDRLSRSDLGPDVLIIFSSVLHEVEDYWEQLEAIIKGTGATVVVRDMRFGAEPEPINKNDLAKVIKNSHPQMLSDFVGKYGMKTDKDMYHWFLKYSYVDNWDLELKENYFNFNYPALMSLGEVLYERNYTLGFKKAKVLKDFGVKLTKPTHTQLIIKLHAI